MQANYPEEMRLVYTKTVDSGFHALRLATLLRLL